MTVDMPNIIETPALDQIQQVDWLTWQYDFKQLKELDELISHHVWVTADRRQMAVASMATSHIQNCIKCWNGQGKKFIPPGYLGGKEKWLKIFNNELLKRQ